MPRVRREKCPNSIYHVIVRGNNKEDIFRDYMDREVYLNRLKRYKEKFQVEVYAYCMMTNHVHLLIYDNGQDISKFMQGLSLSYAIYFNKKYNRCGHLFQGRFTSAMVRSDDYFLHVSKYIHLNPVKANIVNEAVQYNWSSFKIYMGIKDKKEIINTKRILKYFADKDREAQQLYLEYVQNGEEVDAAEVAIALEPACEIQKESRESTKGANVKRVFKVVEQTFGIHRLELIRKNNKNCSDKRDICIYLMGLTTKLSYKELAEIFLVKPAAIGISIKRMIEKMILNKQVLQQVSTMAKLIVS